MTELSLTSKRIPAMLVFMNKQRFRRSWLLTMQNICRIYASLRAKSCLSKIDLMSDSTLSMSLGRFKTIVNRLHHNIYKFQRMLMQESQGKRWEETDLK